MFELYYSEDKGLLDEKFGDFEDRFGKCRVVRNPSPEDLELFLLQPSTEEDEEGNLVIELHEDSKLFKASSKFFFNLITSIDLDKRTIMLLIKSKKVDIPLDVENILDNKDPKIKSLDNRTKRGYINNLIKKKKIKINKDFLDVLKDLATPDASNINELVENMVTLSEANLLDKDSLSALMSTVKKEVNYFEFIMLYVSVDTLKGISFINKNLNSKDSIKRFLCAFIFRLMELKRFLRIKEMHARDDDLKKISVFLKAPINSLYEYRKMNKIFGPSLEEGLDKFIIEIYFFYSSLRYSHLVDAELLKLFLLRNKPKA